MASPSSQSPPEARIDDEDDQVELPMTMAASFVIEQLPKDAHKALESAGELEHAKVTIHFKPLPNTPQLRQPRQKCSSNQRFESIVRALRRKLALKDHESVFCYINSVFAPGLDEGVANLWRCFKVGDELVVNYSITQAFG
ncbi:hypothetical protein AMS68_007431 [Peltaster fructicola]|uniref:Ubiquitin-like protein ATG12 n=1 Tax=Peltaster fructicola TaxID=286661 RepID=A0A6H0Y4H3_9PEZI|nr:hypothetical protein AMS68_007431 [Peltaster fructicola]